MSEVTRETLETGVSLLWPGEHSWDNLLSCLRKHPVHFPGNVVVEFVSEETDGSWDDASAFIFKTTNWDGYRTWRVTTTTSSFGDTYNAALDEVQAVETKVTKWERI